MTSDGSSFTAIGGKGTPDCWTTGLFHVPSGTTGPVFIVGIPGSPIPVARGPKFDNRYLAAVCISGTVGFGTKGRVIFKWRPRCGPIEVENV
jgi:hypothetical protein